MIAGALIFVTALMVVSVLFYATYPAVSSVYTVTAALTPVAQTYLLDNVRRLYDYMPYIFIPLLIVWVFLYTQRREPVWEEQPEAYMEEEE